MNESPRQVATPETLSRGDAMKAGERWFGAHSYAVAHQANYSALEEIPAGANAQEKNYAIGEAWHRAYNALQAVKELPPASENPEMLEQIWRMRVEMFARITGITAEEADAQLREDFKEYLRLLTGLMDEWRHRDLTATECSLPWDPHQAFSYFWLNRCGGEVEESMAELRRLHAADCCSRS